MMAGLDLVCECMMILTGHSPRLLKATIFGAESKWHLLDEFPASFFQLMTYFWFLKHAQWVCVCVMILIYFFKINFYVAGICYFMLISVLIMLVFDIVYCMYAII